MQWLGMVFILLIVGFILLCHWDREKRRKAFILSGGDPEVFDRYNPIQTDCAYEDDFSIFDNSPTNPHSQLHEFDDWYFHHKHDDSMIYQDQRFDE